MKEDSRKQAIAHLEELRTLAARAGGNPNDHASLLAHIDELQALVQQEQPGSDLQLSASGLEQRLLAWEAEHPRLVALASRVARTLENAGL